jgi:N-acetylmuramic acid 6-phosphate etherase
MFKSNMKYTLPPTEMKSNNHQDIDKLDDSSSFNLLVNANDEAVKSVSDAKEYIHKAIDQILLRLNKSSCGRIIYCGAGTSARIGVQDGSELYPTFGWPHSRIDYIIAGGNAALLRPLENAEDDKNNATDKVIDVKVNENDIIIGLAASGNTPFTCQVLKESRKKGALTIGISNNKNSLLNEISEFNIILDTGPEPVVGSTRLKAGTAQKICLNIISTILMIKLGRVKNGMMNYLVPTNKKLKKRQALIKKSLNL